MRRNALLLFVGAVGWAIAFRIPSAPLCIALSLASGAAIGVALVAALRALQEDE